MPLDATNGRNIVKNSNSVQMNGRRLLDALDNPDKRDFNEFPLGTMCAFYGTGYIFELRAKEKDKDANGNSDRIASLTCTNNIDVITCGARPVVNATNIVNQLSQLRVSDGVRPLYNHNRMIDTYHVYQNGSAKIEKYESLFLPSAANMGWIQDTIETLENSVIYYGSSIMRKTLAAGRTYWIGTHQRANPNIVIWINSTDGNFNCTSTSTGNWCNVVFCITIKGLS